MFSVPLYIFLIAFALFVIIFILFSIANVYHIVSTATFTFPVAFVTVLTVAWCFSIVLLTYIGTNEANWSADMLVLGPNGLISFE